MGFTLAPIEAGLSALWENKPEVPDFHWTDLVQQQLQTAEGNLQSLELGEQIGSDVNDFMRGERAKTLAGVPGLDDLETQTVDNLKRWLSGELGDDLTSTVQRGANARAFSGGYQGSGMGRNLEARDLGLTGLQLQQSAVPLAGQYMSGATGRRAIPEWNPASMFINPMAAAEFNARQSNQMFNRDWLAERIKNQPEPWQQSIMDSTAAASAAGDQLLMSYAGMAMGSPGGMMGGSGGGGGSNWGSGGPPPAYDPYNYSW